MEIRLDANLILEQRRVGAKFLRRLLSPRRSPLVKMFGDEIHRVRAPLEHTLRPTDLALLCAIAQIDLRAEVAGAHEDYFRVNLPHGDRKTVVLLRVVIELHIAELPRAPHFIADAPVFHAVWLAIPVLGTP